MGTNRGRIRESRPGRLIFYKGKPSSPGKMQYRRVASEVFLNNFKYDSAVIHYFTVQIFCLIQEER
jgi:hypothetical protein